MALFIDLMKDLYYSRKESKELAKVYAHNAKVEFYNTSVNESCAVARSFLVIFDQASSRVIMLVNLAESTMQQLEKLYSLSGENENIYRCISIFNDMFMYNLHAPNGATLKDMFMGTQREILAILKTYDNSINAFPKTIEYWSSSLSVYTQFLDDHHANRAPEYRFKNCVEYLNECLANENVRFNTSALYNCLDEFKNNFMMLHVLLRDYCKRLSRLIEVETQINTYWQSLS